MSNVANFVPIKVGGLAPRVFNWILVFVGALMAVGLILYALQFEVWLYGKGGLFSAFAPIYFCLTFIRFVRTRSGERKKHEDMPMLMFVFAGAWLVVVMFG
ncbi:MAG: hypothetical protein WAW92_03085 [Minisyncoccia bacterium]